MKILGISAFYHDSAAALVVDGEVVAAAQEERFTRKKHDAAFPDNAIAYCLRRGDVGAEGVDAVVYYDKPITTFVRLLKTYLRVGPKGIRSFSSAMPIWTREKLWIPYEIERGLAAHRLAACRRTCGSPSTTRATPPARSSRRRSSTPRSSPSTAWASGRRAASASGAGNQIELQRQLNFPNSLGLLYSAFTYFCGFRVNSGEYKLMGLAPYGEPVYVDRIFDHLVDLRPDGSFRMEMKYFNYLSGLTMTNRRFADLFDGPPRAPESEITQRELDLAASIQVVTEEIVLGMARAAATSTGARNACLAGGVALNCVANGRLLREGPFERLWIQPAAGDAGGAVGAALYGWHQILGQPARGRRRPRPDAGRVPRPALRHRRDRGLARRTRLSVRTARGRRAGGAHRRARSPTARSSDSSQGRMEFGPRALGHRSIVGDPALAGDAVDHEPEDQVPRVVPAVRARRARRPGRASTSRSSRASSRRTCCSSPTSVPSSASTTSTITTRSADLRTLGQRDPLDHPRGHPRRLLGPAPDRRPRVEPRLPRDHRGVRPADRLSGRDQHVVQRAR